MQPTTALETMRSTAAKRCHHHTDDKWKVILLPIMQRFKLRKYPLYIKCCAVGCT